jgi:putative membrane protein
MESTMWNPEWRRSGKEPDYRFLLANERTFLAWIRTALSLLAGGVLLVQFAVRLSPRTAVVAIATALAAYSALVCALAYVRWRDSEIAMRHDRPLPASLLVPMTAVLMAVVSAVLVALTVVG